MKAFFIYSISIYQNPPKQCKQLCIGKPHRSVRYVGQGIVFSQLMGAALEQGSIQPPQGMLVLKYHWGSKVGGACF